MEFESFSLKKNHPFALLQREEKNVSSPQTQDTRPNTVQCINDVDEFLVLKERWGVLNATSSKGSVFTSWEWLYTWWETYQSDGQRQLYILVYLDEFNHIQGIAPFQIIKQIKYFPCTKQLVYLGTGETDGSEVFGEYADLLIEPGLESTVIEAFSEYLMKFHKDWHGIKFHQLLKDSHLSKLLSQTKRQHDIVIEKKLTEDGFRTYIDLPLSYDDYLQSLRKKKRNNITRTFKRLAEEQVFDVERVTLESERLAKESGEPGAIDVLASLNLERRGNMNKNSVFEQSNFIEFHKALIKRLIPLDQVRLLILNFEQVPMAMLYSYKDKGVLHAYQSGFDTEQGHRYSLLTTMLTQEIKNSIQNIDIKRFNFMYSDEKNTYKHRYSGTTEIMYKLGFEKQGLRYELYKGLQVYVKPILKKLLKLD